MRGNDLDSFVVELKRIVCAVATKGWATSGCRTIRVALPVVDPGEVCKCTTAVTVTLLREVILCTYSGKRCASVA